MWTPPKAFPSFFNNRFSCGFQTSVAVVLPRLGVPQVLSPALERSDDYFLIVRIPFGVRLTLRT